jgi:hypothetical protein
MKRVRYLAGVFGLAPLVAGVAATGATAATTAAAPPRHPPRAKSVSMRPVRHIVETNSQCDGTWKVSIPRYHNVSGWYWWTKEPDGWLCVGTVDVNIYTGKPTTQEITVSVLGTRATGLFDFEYHFPDETIFSPSTDFPLSIHRLFAPAESMGVCLDVTNFAGPACQNAFDSGRPAG